VSSTAPQFPVSGTRTWAPIGIAVRRVLFAWATTRLGLLLAALVISPLVGTPGRGTDAAVPGPLSILGSWDTTWYLDISRHGYPADTSPVGTTFTNFAFFPFVPGIMAVGSMVGLNPFWTGLIVANTGLLVALAGMDWLTRREFGPAIASRVVWTAALLPTSLYAALPYTEGPVLGIAVICAVLALRGQVAIAGLLAAFVALARPPGMLVALLVVLIALRNPATSRWRAVALGGGPAALAVSGFLLWMQQARGSWSLPFDAQRPWGRGQPIIGLFTTLPGLVERAWNEVIHGRFTSEWTSVLRDLLALGVATFLILALAKMVGWRSPWTIYSILCLAIPLSSGSSASLARFSVLAFPLIWPIAVWVGEVRRRQLWIASSAVTLTLLFIVQLKFRAP
jgi:hypothetical protein